MRLRLFDSKLIYVSLILLSLFANSIFCDNTVDHDQKIHQKLELNTEKQYFFNGTHYNQTVYLKYTIEGKIDPDNDLLLIARPNDFKSDPDIMVSRTIEFPTPDNADYRCWHSGLDICYIPASWFEGTKEIYITLFSFLPYSNFTFEAKFQHRTEQMIEWNKDTVLFLGSPEEQHPQSQQVVKIYVPPEESIEHFTFSAIVDPLSRQNLTEAIKLYVMFGNETPSNSKSLWGIYSSSYGETFTAFKYQPTFRTGINYTMLIVGQTNTTVNLLCRKDTAEPVKLHFNMNSDKQKTLFDAIPVGRHLVYELDTGIMTRDEKTNKLNQTLLINLLVQQGNPDMYIDCDTPLRLETLGQAKWVSDSNGLESLIISAQEFQKYEKQCNKLYITIYARVCAAFALEFSIREQFHNEDIVIPINALVSENGYIEDNQIVNYLLQMSKSQKETVIVSLTAKNGNPDLYVKKCKDSNTCRVTRQQLENLSSVEKEDFIGLSNQVGNDYITFNHSSENCEQSNSIFCQYLITVFANPAAGNNAPTSEIHYSLLVQYQSKSVQLYENNPLYQRLEVEQFNFYSYSLVSLEGIKKIYFQVTPISGIMELLVSRYHKNPNFRETERIACFCSNVISYTNEELSMAKMSSINFYMSVYGFSSSVYTISVYIERYQKDENGKDDPNSSIISIKLINDMPQKYVFESSSDSVFFDIIESESDPIVSLNPLKGEFAIEAWPLYSSNVSIYNAPDESSGEVVYRSQHNSAILHVKRVKELSNLNGFRVRVQKLVNRDQAQFIIEYSTQTKITNLFENKPIQTFIKPDQIKFFKFEISYDDYIVAVSYTSAHTGLIMSISGDAVNKDDTPAKYETNSMSESSIYIFNAFKSECQTRVEEKNEDCILYGTIEMSEKAQQNYTEEKESLPTQISLVKFNRQLKTQSLQLNDGSINYFPIPSEESKSSEFYTLNFYVHPTNFENDIQAIATLEHGNMKMKYYILDTSGPEMSKPNMWDKYYPTISDVEIRRITDDSNEQVREKQSEMFNIDKGQFLCKPKCVVLITVFAKNVKKIKQNSSLALQVISETFDVQLQESVEIAGSVSHGQYKYYKLYLPRNQTIITFSAVSTQSFLDINLVAFYSKYYKERIFRPTETNCKSDTCKFSNLEPGNYDQIEYSPANSGYYIVGVYGSEGYTIDYKFSWSANQIQYIKSNQSYRSHLSSQKSFVFYADLFKNYGFQLSIAVLDEYNNNIVGDGALSLAIYHCNSDYLNGCLEDKPEFKEIKVRDITIDYQDLCADNISCIIVLSFKSSKTKNIVFDFLIEELKRNKLDYVTEVITIQSDQSIVAKISKDQKKRYKINIPYVLSQSKYIVRVQQLTGNVNISLWPKEQHSHQLLDNFRNFKWFEIDTEQSQIKDIHIDIFSCDLNLCTFDIALYPTNTPKDISKLQSIAEYLTEKPIIITGTNESFRRSRLALYFENRYYDLEKQVINIQKNGQQLQKIIIRQYQKYYLLEDLYDSNLSPSTDINIFIQLDNQNVVAAKNKQIPIAIIQMKFDGVQIPLINAPQNAQEQNLSLKLYKFSSEQSSAIHIIEPPQTKQIILIDVRSCGGQLKVEGSSFLDSFETKKVDLEMQSLLETNDRQIYYTYVYENNKKIYIKTSRPSSSIGKEQKYLLGTYMLADSKRPQDSPVIKTQTRKGFVEIKKVGQQYVLTWDMLSGSAHFNNPKHVHENTQFILIIDNGQQKRAQNVQKCNVYDFDEYSASEKEITTKQQFAAIHIKQDSVQIDEVNQFYSATIDLEQIIKENLPDVNLEKLDDLNLFFTIKAQISPSIYGDFSNAAVWYNEVDYDVSPIDSNIFNKDVEIQPATSNSDMSYIIITLTIIVAFSMILLGFFLFRRYRLTQKKIQYEVSYREEIDMSSQIGHTQDP